jgi:hypothetical protein
VGLAAAMLARRPPSRSRPRPARLPPTATTSFTTASNCPGGGTNDDYPIGGDSCPGGVKASAWDWVDGVLKRSKYNGNASTDVTGDSIGVFW